MLTKTHIRRVLTRPKTYIPALAVFVLCWILLAHHGGYRVVPFYDRPVNTERDPDERKELALQAQRQLFEKDWRDLEKKPGLGAVYGNTLNSLTDRDTRKPSHEAKLTLGDNSTSFTKERPAIYNPYPKYNSKEWLATHARYVPCIGATGDEVEDIKVFRGRPRNFPDPGFGSYSTLGLDRNLCFERETRMGQYGVNPVMDKDGQPVNWDKVNWGELQSKCVDQNQARFATSGPPNAYVDEEEDSEPSPDLKKYDESAEKQTPKDLLATFRRFWRGPDARPLRSRSIKGVFENKRAYNSTVKAREARTAILLRSYTGKEYNDNDKQAIRSLITELSLRTGGEYQVFLFVHYREDEFDIWASEDLYRQAIEKHVPEELRSITILWTEGAVDKMYPKLTVKARKVHNGQFLPVQMFMQEFREFDYVWNWEMDSRVVGHHYNVLNKLAEFGRKQPRRGLWERNERFYIPSYYGGFESKFRQTVERQVGDETIWGAPKLPVVNPVGPKPPVENPKDDNYKWGVGEEADLITLAPIFNPVNSGWIMRNQVWGYRNLNFPWGKLPRRATIITQVRASRRLIDVMHAEDLRGNHVASEMVSQTTALLHGLKAVYAPMPVYFDRAWSGSQLAKWFNGGPKGQSGSFGSAMGWGQEGRYLGSTWYYRAIPPQRLYNNWMGYEDTGIGGPEWEQKHGRTCLPSMILHPIKEVKPTEKGYSTDSKLPYD
ncbi:Putative protein of unknown function [Podospora comata]|uniref:Uncharacterized protein n=1 Tax=Podospora comata TaxID=48703 RepID=A0ABY6S133_PODCO|nr:Putative protein of unknown function [Podospora comata]